ncbi:MAG: hypothetical protein JRJ69_11235 [Deltaproteobacteria bacterium]|nr:hypothetical protein [Deltaproteobacteria bacterium]
MDEAEYKGKYINLRILKSIQEYLKKDGAASPTAVYPIRVPDELLFQVLQLEGAENADSLIHDGVNNYTTTCLVPSRIWRSLSKWSKSETGRDNNSLT